MPTRQSTKYSEIRIIAGFLRSRKIVFPALPELRPTPNRIRETLFNWLAPHIRGARCLDLFAGSGALSFEALSRGASYCLLLDSCPEIIEALKHNKRQFKLDHLDILRATFPYTLNIPSEKFDIVFLDPPFKSDYIPRALTWLLQNHYVGTQSLVYVESAKDQDGWSNFSDWQVLKDKVAGGVRYTLLQPK